MALHTACGEIREVKFEDNALKVIIKEKYLYDILTKQENLQRILLEFSKINDKIKLEFVLRQSCQSLINKNIDALKDLFGDEVQII